MCKTTEKLLSQKFYLLHKSCIFVGQDCHFILHKHFSRIRGAHAHALLINENNHVHAAVRC